MSGTSTRADVHANWMPPHVSAMATEVELAITRPLPLSQRVEHETRTWCSYGRGKDIHPVHPLHLLLERPLRRAELEEEEHERGGDAADGQVQVWWCDASTSTLYERRQSENEVLSRIRKALVQNIHRHWPPVAAAPPISGPTVAATPNALRATTHQL